MWAHSGQSLTCGLGSLHQRSCIWDTGPNPGAEQLEWRAWCLWAPCLIAGPCPLKLMLQLSHAFDYVHYVSVSLCRFWTRWNQMALEGMAVKRSDVQCHHMRLCDLSTLVVQIVAALPSQPSRRTLISTGSYFSLGFCIPIQMLCRQQVSHEELLVSAYLKSSTWFLSMCMRQRMKIEALQKQVLMFLISMVVRVILLQHRQIVALDPSIHGQTQCKPRHSCFLWMLKNFEFFCAISASLAGALIEDPVCNISNEIKQ